MMATSTSRCCSCIGGRIPRYHHRLRGEGRVAHVVIALMGVAGSGKTFVGTALASELGWRFIDADDLHPRSNIEKMKSGVPLDDADREPWLDRISFALAAQEGNVVLACSALRQAFRDRLPGVRFVHLRAPVAVLADRLGRRSNHFMPPSLLSSQLAALEEPPAALILDSTQPVTVLVQRIRQELNV